ncbi:GGDEF domain-containing protein [Catenovulum sp. SM1970]|uniref:GGDEF domain-containing protein n=1 Tax=Marinifaba aquimaris TaxID=2741323 RepID=UPI0015718159|nr:GGDEF domain-containing protein [Marinifaba aquimaris]NTS76487.1 GGDEF domain-containing protein [Marinifaba aquimaris]
MIISFLAILAEELLLKRSLKLTPDSSNVAIYNSDDSRVTGASRSTLKYDENGFLLDCHIVQSNYAWPYCSIVFDFSIPETSSQPFGYDLSGYSEVEIEVSYLTPDHRNLGARFQSRNFNPAYSQIGNFDSLKFGTLEFFPAKEEQVIKFNLQDMNVPSWWLGANKVTLSQSRPEYGDVILLEVSTDSTITPGHYQLRLTSLTLKGRYLADIDLYLLISLLWVCCGFLLLVKRLNVFKFALMETHKEKQNLNEIVIRDQLTGCYNRNALDQFLSSTSEQSINTEYSLIICDIDHFKQINDQYGHLVGDQVLTELVKLVSRYLTPSQKLIRWGGEEFIILCPNTKADNAVILAQSIRTAVQQATWPEQIQLTASFGVAEKESQEHQKALMHRADLALYHSKRTGRNKVSLAGYDQSIAS